MNYKALITLTLFFILSLSSIAGGPWIPKKNDGAAFVSFTPLLYYSVSTNSEQHKNLNRLVGEYTFQAYIEQGLGKGWMVFANLPLRHVRIGQEIENTDGDAIKLNREKKTASGNIDFGVKTGIINDKKWLLTATFALSFPTAYTSDSSQIRTGYDSWIAKPGLELGRSWGRWYFQSGFWYHLRTNNYQNQIYLSTEAGYTTKRNWIVALNIHWLKPVGEGSYQDNLNLKTALYANQQEFLAYHFKFAKEWNKHFGTNVGIGGGAYTKLTARTPALTFGFYTKW